MLVHLRCLTLSIPLCRPSNAGRAEVGQTDDVTVYSAASGSQLSKRSKAAVAGLQMASGCQGIARASSAATSQQSQASDMQNAVSRSRAAPAEQH